MRVPATLITAIAALTVFAAAAAGKGPTEATIAGPGLATPISMQGYGEGGGNSAIARLTDEGGFFPAAFGQSPDPMLPEWRGGELGTPYRLDYGVPGPEGADAVVRQELYPYADGGPAFYTEPGQRFMDGLETHGGWWQATPALLDVLVRSGLPRTPPGQPDSSGRGLVFVAATVCIALLGLGASAWVLTRRRRAPETSPA